jgi:mannose-6-phosphate isomerase
LTPSEQKTITKPWGHELIFAHTKDCVGNVLVIKAEHSRALQFHKVKEETIFLRSGEMRLMLEYDHGQLSKTNFKAGQSCHIPANRKRPMSAVNDCEIFEVSAPYLDDVVSLEDSYGRVLDMGSVS